MISNSGRFIEYFSPLLSPAVVFILIMAASAVSHSQNLELVGTYPTTLFNSTDIEISGHYAYIAGGSVHGGSLLIIDFSTPTAPALVGQALGEAQLSRLVVSGNYAYALKSSNLSLYAVDITNPANPAVVDSFVSQKRTAEICKAGAYLYISGEDSGLTIISIADPADPIIVAEYPFPAHPSDLSASGNYLYTGNANVLTIYDISDPLNVTAIMSDTISVNDIIIYDNKLFAAFNGHGYYAPDSKTTIFDITNQTDPQLVGVSSIGGYRIAVSGNYAFVINKTPEIYFFQSYLDVIDISNPGQPVHMSHENLGYKNDYYTIESRNDTLFMADGDYYNPRFAIYRVLNYGQGALEGYVLDKYDNQPVVGAEVLLKYTGLADTTDSQGHFFFGDLYNLHYDLDVSCSGYYTKSDTGFAVIVNDTTSYTILLDRPTRVDVGISGILSPPSWFKADTTYSLKSYVFNYGTASAHNIQSIFEIYYKNTISPCIVDTQYIDSLLPRTNQIVVYDDSLIITAETSITIISYTTLSGDENRDNDTCVFINGTYPAVEVWYGNPQNRPISGQAGGLVLIDVYIRTRPHAYVANMLLNLGTNDQYIDSLMSRQYGSFYYPLNAWDDVSFLSPQHSPPNQSGWSSQAFLGFSDLGGSWNPSLHYESPTRIMTMAVHLVGDTSLIGDTLQAFGTGRHTTYGNSCAGDTVGGPGYQIREHFCPLFIRPSCDYVPGDINGDGHSIGGDVTYGVRYFKSQGLPPVDSCYMDSTDTWFYPAGDVNGNCEFRGSDITRMVAYFKSTASLSHCHFFPPTR
jgi:hypothetical protein